jgi:hypothetical protein
VAVRIAPIEVSSEPLLVPGYEELVLLAAEFASTYNRIVAKTVEAQRGGLCAPGASWDGAMKDLVSCLVSLAGSGRAPVAQHAAP